jgi:hypothetical protein
MDEPWRHEPPCPHGGFTEVSVLVMESGGRCPLCGAYLTAPAPIQREREAEKARWEAWEPLSPRDVLALMGDRRPGA